MDELTLATFGSDRISPETVREISLLRPANETVLFSALMIQNASVETGQPEFTWYTDDLDVRRTQVDHEDDDYTSGTTSIVVANGNAFYPECLILAEATGEVMYCVAVTGNTITVVRGVGSVRPASADSVADEAVLRNIGSARGEGGPSPIPRQSVPAKHSNITQQHRLAVELTGTLMRTQKVTEPELARQTERKYMQLTRDIEHQLLYGAKSDDVANAQGRRARTSAGVLQAIETHVDNVDGSMTLKRFHQFCESAFHVGSPEKLLAAGSTLYETLQDVSIGTKQRIENLAQASGFRVTRLMTPYGDLNLIYHKGLNGAYAGTGVVIDLDEVRMRHTTLAEGIDAVDGVIPNGLPQLRPIGNGTGSDSVKREWSAELGLEWGDERTHAVISGVTGSAA